MGKSLFTGLGELWQSAPSQQSNATQELRVFPGVALEVCLEPGTPLYKSNRDIGTIRFRDLLREYNKSDKDCSLVAYPLDRSVARYPMPGEEVLIIKALGDVGGTEKTVVVGDIYYYVFIVSALNNVTYNTNPFLGIALRHVDTSNPDLTFDEAKVRFNKETKDINLVKSGDDKPKVYKQLQPFEGDFILQGRFGNSIRFGSTSAKTSTPWASGASSPGSSGDGILILRADRDFAQNESDMLTQEDINTDDSSIWICTTQKVELQLACSTELKSWRSQYGISDASNNQGSSMIAKTKDTSKLCQKPGISSKPTNQQYNPPTK